MLPFVFTKLTGYRANRLIRHPVQLDEYWNRPSCRKLNGEHVPSSTILDPW